MRYMKEYTEIVFQEVPDEISLAFSITGCGKHCVGCHTPILQDKLAGDMFTIQTLTEYLDYYDGFISNILFFGGDLFVDELIPMLKYTHSRGVKTTLYTGFTAVDDDIKKNLDYLKTGAYIAELGALGETTTNQVMINVVTGEDITYKFNRGIGNN